MEKVEFSYPNQNSVNLTIFKVSGLMRLQCLHWILLYKRVLDWHLIKNTKSSRYFDLGGVDC